VPAAFTQPPDRRRRPPPLRRETSSARNARSILAGCRSSSTTSTHEPIRLGLTGIELGHRQTRACPRT